MSLNKRSDHLFLWDISQASLAIVHKSPAPELDSLLLFQATKNIVEFPENDNKSFCILRPSQNRIILKTPIEKNDNCYIEVYSIRKGGSKVLAGKLKIDVRPFSQKKRSVHFVRVKCINEMAYPIFTASEKIKIIDGLNSLYLQASLQFEEDLESYSDTLALNIEKNIKTDANQLFRLLGSCSELYHKEIDHVIYLFKHEVVENSRGLADIPGQNIALQTLNSVVLAHEAAHNLGLQHTFENKQDGFYNVCNVGVRELVKLSTLNIMDYIYEHQTANDPRKYFLKYQMDYIFKKSIQKK